MRITLGHLKKIIKEELDQASRVAGTSTKTQVPWEYRSQLDQISWKLSAAAEGEYVDLVTTVLPMLSSMSSAAHYEQPKAFQDFLTDLSRLVRAKDYQGALDLINSAPRS